MLMAMTLVVGVSLPGFAQQSGQSGGTQSSGAQTEEKKPAPDLTGKWNMSVETSQGVTPAQLQLKLEGKKVTGTISSQAGETAVEGEYAERKLALKFPFQTQNGSIVVALAGAMKDDGTMAGTLDFNGQAIPWKAERAKEK
jgi:hypothetical protein